MTVHHHVLNHLKPHAHHSFGQRSMDSSQTAQHGATLVERSASSSTCSANNKSAVCQKPTDSAGTLTIALAAAIPLCVAIVVLFFLHRRIRRKLRAEDANDKHKSLDFGLGEMAAGAKGRKGKKAPEMAIADVENTLRQPFRTRGLSMDMSSPYLLPAGVSGSHDSLHSMSRARQDSEFDPYRPVTMVSNEQSPMRSRMRDNSSVHTGSSGRSGDTPNAGLLRNAARMSRTDERMHAPAVPQHGAGQNDGQRPPRQASLGASAHRNDRWYPMDDTKYGGDSPSDLLTGNPATPKDMLSDKPTLPPFPQPVQMSRTASPEPMPDSQDSQLNFTRRQKPNDGLFIQVPSPTHFRQSPPRSPAAYEYRHEQPHPTIQEPSYADATDHGPPAPPAHDHDYPDYPMEAMDMRRVSVMGMRPLPPDDPSDNPEQRANRIRSFYKEYFDESKPNPPGHYPQAQPDPYDEYYNYADYLNDGAIYDPETGAFFTPQRPFEHSEGRRAMTPPPRGPSHFQLGHRSAASTQSAGRNLPVPKKRLPPPAALKSLPTPHMLRDDMSSVSPIDFAPPTTYRDRQLGRGLDSPTGVSRPYSPAFRPHLPLAQSFDDLAVMPSPHALRTSGTYTALDFAPPPRFRKDDSGSDAGSIRSNRSGLSAVQARAIRDGAYRVSRLPKEMVGTTTDLTTTLKPSWDMRN